MSYFVVQVNRPPWTQRTNLCWVLIHSTTQICAVFVTLSGGTTYLHFQSSCWWISGGRTGSSPSGCRTATFRCIQIARCSEPSTRRRSNTATIQVAEFQLKRCPSSRGSKLLSRKSAVFEIIWMGPHNKFVARVSMQSWTFFLVCTVVVNLWTLVALHWDQRSMDHQRLIEQFEQFIWCCTWSTRSQRKKETDTTNDAAKKQSTKRKRPHLQTHWRLSSVNLSKKNE